MIPVAAPALPIDEAGKYVAGAYVVFVALLLIYVAIMSARLGRIDRELGELADIADRRVGDSGGAAVGRAPDQPSLSSARPAESGREAEHLGGGVSHG